MAATTVSSHPLTQRINRIQESATMAVAAEAGRLKAQGVDIADFSAGEPHFDTPQHIKDAAIAAINANFTRYTPVAGTLEVRQAIVARHAADFGSRYLPEEAIASTGAKQALFNAFQVLVEHGDEVILPSPYWVSFYDIIRYCGGTPAVVATDESQGFSLTAAMIERALTPRTRAILLNSPSNPSGAVMKPEDLQAILQLAARRNLMVISDECYAYLDFTGKRFSLGGVAGEAERDHLLVVGSLSKTYAMTGWRLGYAMGPKWLIAAMNKLQSQSTSNPTSIVQKAAVAALTGPQDCLPPMLAEYVRLRDRTVAGLREIPGIQCALPGGAFYVFPNVSAYLRQGVAASPAELAGRLLREANVAVVPGEAFGSQRHIRISYPTSLQNIEKGLERMQRFFAALP
jgi:aspartate aminotransferase